MKGTGDRTISQSLLKVLSGTHVGAQIALPDSGVSIGRAEDCDVYLNDPHIVEHHCKLRPVADEIEIQVGEGAVYLEGQKIQEATARAKAYQVITLGSTHIACGPTSAIWPAITFPRIFSAEGASAPPAPPSPAGHNASRWRLAAGISILALAFAAAILYWGFQGGPAPAPFQVPASVFAAYSQNSPPPNQATLVEAITSTIHKALPEASVSSWELLGRPAITIRVRGPQEAQTARDIIDNSSKFLVANIIDLDVLEQSIDSFLEQQHFPVHVTIQQDGTAVWTGYLPDRDAWTAMLEAIALDLPSLEKNVCQIVFGTDLRNQMEKSLIEAGLGQTVKVVPERTAFVISGNITTSQEAAWAKVKAALVAQTGPNFPIKDTVLVQTAAAPPPLVLPSPVVAVQSSGVPRISLADGSVIFPGGQLADGYTLEGIQADRLELRGPEGDISLPLEQLIDSNK